MRDYIELVLVHSSETWAKMEFQEMQALGHFWEVELKSIRNQRKNGYWGIRRKIDERNELD